MESLYESKGDPASIEVSYDYTRNFVSTANRIVRRNYYRVLFLMICFISIFQFCSSTGGLKTKTIAYVVSTMLFAAIFIAIQYRIRSSQFKKSPIKNSKVKIDIDSEKFEVKTIVSESRILWKAIAKVIQTPAGFIAYIGTGVAYWLPKDCFRSADEYERFLILAKSNSACFRKRTWLW